HMGTALNKVLKDFIIKYKRMSGFDAPFVPGWDTHGLPIEYQIVKTKKVNRHEVGDVEFRRMCRDYALKYVDIQREQLIRLGVGGDWQNPYLTLRPEFEAKQIEIFGQMARKGFIYKGLKPVFWCPQCETALAEAEIEYRDRRSPSIYVKFPVIDDRGLFDGTANTFVLIWTTTPWTIPANLAICLNPEFDYLLAEVKGERLVFAAGLAEEVLQAAAASNYTEIKRFKGSELEGVICRHPLIDRESPLILGNHVTLEQGTGCVHTAPGHGQDDYEVGIKYGLPIYAPMDGKGVFTGEAGRFAGLDYNQGNKAVTEELEKNGSLMSMAFIEHQYPHCWRCKDPVLFRATEQWFASVEGFRADALRSIKEVKWIPSWGEERMSNMVAERSDWCISRQRIWGVPIPIFYCDDCQKTILDDETIKFVAAVFKEEGSDAWFTRDAADLLPPGYKCECGSVSFRKETDTMDVWFDSGSSHAAVCEQREELGWPADLYIEGSDQYRGWFQSSLLTAVATRGRAPYRSVISHGWVVDGDGKKMSKSLGNVIAPAEIIKRYGGDILRLWVSSADFKSDVRVSTDIFKQLVEVYRKIRNTCRFLLSNCYDFNIDKDAIAYEELLEIDRYMLGRLQELIALVTEAYEEFEYHRLFHAIHNFCVLELSNFYLDVLKDRLYVRPAFSRERRSAQTAMYEILKTLTLLMAPVLVFTAEEIWRHLPGEKEESIQLAALPKVKEKYLDYELMQKWQKMLKLREEITRALEEKRKGKEIGSSLEAAITIYPDREAYETLVAFRDDLAELFIVSECILEPPSEADGGMKIVIERAKGTKCPRCWTYSESMGKHEYPDLCARCEGIMTVIKKERA
ncbi:MAG TPA: isoleucine--tRNA ligase, partial [Firmicutes bacterium]|nr:isoleucine--tRNA ligase [Bacillota bacterium]